MFTQASKSTEKILSIGLSGRNAHENVLANVVSGAPSHLLQNDQWRKYTAIVTTSTILQGKQEFSPKAVNYYVGRAEQAIELPPTTKGNINPKSDEGVTQPKQFSAPKTLPVQKHKKQKNIATGMQSGAYAREPSVEMGVRCSSGMVDEFVGAARKYANVPTDFAYMDQAGTIQRLAAAIAFYASYGELTKDHMLNELPLVVTSVGSAIASATSNRNGTFISKSADQTCATNTLAALCFAVCGEGGTVVTDIVAIEAGSNRALVGNPVDSDLAEGCYNALCFIADNYNQVGAGEIFAYALTRGLHSVVTVNGHSDEGGVMRSILRASGFAIPYGGISVTKNGYTGLPRPSGSSALAWTTWVDNIALMTAGLVAVCDPCVEKDGMLFPTVLTNRRRGPHLDLTEPADTSAAEATYLGAELSNVMPEFAKLYAGELLRAFRGTGGAGSMVVAHMTLCANLLAVHGDRHLMYEVVAPFYWIEPTSVVSGSAADLPANVGGFGVLCERGEGTSKPGMEKVYSYESSGFSHLSVVRWRTARTNPALIHLNMHHEDGLANITFRQVNDAGFGLTGAVRGAKTVREAVENEVDLADFHWQRGDCELPHPAECLYVDGAVGLATQLMRQGTGRHGVELNHAFKAEEWASGSVTFQVSRPEYMRNCHYSSFTRTEKRHRTQAMAAISASRRGAVQTINDNLMPIRFGVVNVGPPVVDVHERKTTDGVREAVTHDVDMRGPSAKAARSDEVQLHATTDHMTVGAPVGIKIAAEQIRGPTRAPTTVVQGATTAAPHAGSAGNEPAEGL